MIIWIWFHTTIWHNLVSAPFISSKINPPYCIIVVNIVHIPISNVRFLTMILQITPPYCIIVVNIIVHIPISNVRFLTMILKKARSSSSPLETIYLLFTKTPYNCYIQTLLPGPALSQISREFLRYRWECNCQKAIYIGTVRD